MFPHRTPCRPADAADAPDHVRRSRAIARAGASPNRRCHRADRSRAGQRRARARRSADRRTSASQRYGAGGVTTGAGAPCRSHLRGMAPARRCRVRFVDRSRARPRAVITRARRALVVAAARLPAAVRPQRQRLRRPFGGAADLRRRARADREPLWADVIWLVPPQTPLVAGSFVFTTDGAWIGLVTTHTSRLAIVPAALAAGRLERMPAERRTAAGIGLEVQALTPEMSTLSGAAGRRDRDLGQIRRDLRPATCGLQTSSKPSTTRRSRTSSIG